jgi:hypothetical protein
MSSPTRAPERSYVPYASFVPSPFRPRRLGKIHDSSHITCCPPTLDLPPPFCDYTSWLALRSARRCRNRGATSGCTGRHWWLARHCADPSRPGANRDPPAAVRAVPNKYRVVNGPSKGGTRTTGDLTSAQFACCPAAMCATLDTRGQSFGVAGLIRSGTAEPLGHSMFRVACLSEIATCGSRS